MNVDSRDLVLKMMAHKITLKLSCGNPACTAKHEVEINGQDLIEATNALDQSIDMVIKMTGNTNREAALQCLAAAMVAKSYLDDKVQNQAEVVNWMAELDKKWSECDAEYERREQAMKAAPVPQAQA